MMGHIGVTPFLLCIDDSEKPDDVVDENWVREGEIYTVRGIYEDAVTHLPKFTLLEKSVYPNQSYGGFDSVRFMLFPFSPN